MSLNLAAPLREAILGMTSVTDLLGTWHGEPCIFTRRPIPDDARFPAVVISPDIVLSDFDALSTFRPFIMRDVAVYGHSIKEAYGFQEDNYRSIETIGYELRRQFHRNRHVLLVEGYNVVDVVAAGPVPAPTGDDRLIGRIVTLTIRLSELT